MLYLILTMAALVRWAPRLWQPHAISTDGYFHLAYSRRIRRNGHRVPDQFDNVILGHRVSYPWLYHWTTSWLPDSWLLVWERYSSAVPDILQCVLLYAFLGQLQHHGVVPTLSEGQLLAAVALLAFSPGLLRVGAGPRAYNGSPRAWGQLFAVSWMCCCTLWSLNGDWRFGLAGALSAALVLLSSKFAVQVLLFFSAVACPFGFFEPVASFAAGTVVAFVVTGGLAVRIWVGHIRHSQFYCRHLQERFLFPNLPTLQTMWTGLRGALNQRSAAALTDWFCREKYTPWLIMFWFPIVWATFAGMLINDGPWLDKSLLAWLAAAVVCCVGTHTRRLRFLGEPERYLEVSMLMCVVGLIALSPSATVVVALLVWYTLLAVVSVWYYARLYAFMSSVNRDFLPLLRPLDRPENRILHVGTLHNLLLHAFERAGIVYHAVNVDESRLSWEEYSLAFGKYPFPCASLGELREKYGLTHVVTSHTYLERFRNNSPCDSFTEHQFDIEYEKAGFVVLRPASVEVTAV